MLIKGLVLAALLVVVARVAGAQPARDGNPPDVVTADNAPFEPAPRDVRVSLDLSAASALWQPLPGDRLARRWLGPASFFDPFARFAVGRPTPLAPVGGRRITRTFLPIPLVQWQRRSSLITPRGLVSVRPTIVIGRRLTCMPQFGRDGRTLGVGVQVRLWLDEPAPRPASALPASDGTDAGILATVRGILDRR